MTDPIQAGATPPQALVEQVKRTTRRMILFVFALPAVIATAMLLLPIVLEDAALTNSADEVKRMWLMISGSLVATYIAHRLTKSWARKDQTAQSQTAENNNGN